MPVICSVQNCGKQAVLKRPKTGDRLCKECFYFAFETEIHVTIEKGELFKRGDKVAIGASGGKDSTVLAYVLKLLNERYNYGLDLYLLSIDEGITGYRDDSLETVKQNRDDYKLPLKILSYKDLYGWTMDEIVAQIGRKNNCTFCGVFRRQALDRGAALIGADMIVTGHNADDIAETVIMNVLRGDLARLTRCTNIITEGEGTIPRCKPLKYAYEKEIVMYAHYKELVYFSTECSYSPNAYRGHTREYIKEVERVRPSCILDIIYSGETLKLKDTVKFPARRTCTRCGFVASQEVCKVCVLLEGLNTGMPKLGIGKSNKAKRIMGLKVLDGSENKSKKKPPTSDGSDKQKRKVKREERKKARSCGGSCSSNCGSENPESTMQDVDMSEANLFDEESACGGSMDTSIPSSSQAVVHESDSDSSEEESPIQIKEKKEIVVCKCPPRLRSNVNRSNRSNPSTTKSNETEDDSDSSSDEIFNMSLFKYLVTSCNKIIPEPALPEEEEFRNLVSQAKALVDDNVNKKSPSSSTAKTPEDLESKLKNCSDNVEKTQPSSSTEKDCDDSTIKQLSLLTVTESGHQESQLADQSNVNQTSDEPTMIKANAKKVKPSLMLPEMMYKAKNNLDF